MSPISQDEIVDAIVPDDADCPHDVVIAGVCLNCEKVVSPLAAGTVKTVESDPRDKGKTYFY
ncbi:MAG: hypothetical protein ABFD76_05055 [Smithella sp.]